MLRYLLLLALFLSSVGVPTEAVQPTTVAEAAKRLDLETLPIMPGAEFQGWRRVAELHYRVDKPTKKVFDFVNQQLIDRQWLKLPGQQASGKFASADYSRDDYVVHLSVFPNGYGTPSVMLSHLGNVPLNKLPVPKAAKPWHAFTGVVAYTCPGNVEETAADCHQLMLAAGWKPYGNAGDTAYYRQNAVLAQVRVMSAPAQNGATVINLSSALLSVELPAPDFAKEIRFSDGTTVLSFKAEKTPQEVADFYRSVLKPAGWEATTDKPVPIKWRQFTIFRNAGQEMIKIQTHEYEGLTVVNVDHQNAKEVATDDMQAHIASGERATYRRKVMPVISIPVPVELTEKEQEAEQLKPWAIKIATPRDKAFAAAEALVKGLAQPAGKLTPGWQADEKHQTAQAKRPVIRTHHLKRGKDSLWLTAIEPPKGEGWVSIVGVGVKVAVNE